MHLRYGFRAVGADELHHSTYYKRKRRKEIQRSAIGLDVVKEAKEEADKILETRRIGHPQKSLGHLNVLGNAIFFRISENGSKTARRVSTYHDTITKARLEVLGGYSIEFIILLCRS